MAKEKKQDSGWQFPKALEIVKCKEGNKEFMKERPARRPFGNTVLICEYPLDGDAMQEPNARMITWRLAKRAARDFLRVSFMTSAIVTAAKADKPSPSFGFTADIKQKGAIQYAFKENNVRRLRIPYNAKEGRNLRCRGTARVCGRADKTTYTV